MGKKFTLALGGGCSLLVLVAIAVMGSATWYAAQFSKEYKAVKKSEKALIEATTGFDEWAPPVEGVTADRLDAFLSVREHLATDRAALARATAEFAAADHGWWSQLSHGADLVPAYAAFWDARNKGLLEKEMGPLEYIFTYRLVYYGWLGKDPSAGVEDSDFDPGGASWLSPWVDPIPTETTALLEANRARLESVWLEATNPLELIFDGLEK